MAKKPEPKPAPKPRAKPKPAPPVESPNSIREQTARDKFDHLIAVDLEAAEAAVAGVVLP